MAWLAKLIGWIGSYILENVLQSLLTRLSKKKAEKKASQAQLKVDDDNAKQFAESKTDEERHKSGERMLNGE